MFAPPQLEVSGSSTRSRKIHGSTFHGLGHLALDSRERSMQLPEESLACSARARSLAL
jgi:hypothetical protein